MIRQRVSTLYTAVIPSNDDLDRDQQFLTGHISPDFALRLALKPAVETLNFNPKPTRMPSVLLDNLFLRKHGAKAYYGQK